MPDLYGFNINFIVEEGIRFKINKIEITSNLIKNKDDYILDNLLLKKGDYFDTRALDKSITDLTDHY